MKFFTDLNVDKAECIGVTSLLSNITNKAHSHKGGWARLLICQLKHLGYETVKLVEEDDFSDYSALIFDLGAEFSGDFNLFGGVDENVFKRLKDLRDFKGNLFSWKHELPDVVELEKRRGNKSNCKEFEMNLEICADARETLELCRSFDHAAKTDKLLLCDSHGPAVWRPEFMIDRRDGRTLSGMLERETIKRKMIEYGWVDTLQVHASSIDIRHHVCRVNDAVAATVALADGLRHRIYDHNTPLKSFIYTHTMGIEDESRRLPKTGYHKGQPFFGTWEERNACREAFNERVEQLASEDEPSWVVAYPPVFFDKQRKLRFDVMERPGSVHISPEHYRWDLENNKQRWPW